MFIREWNDNNLVTNFVVLSIIISTISSDNEHGRLSTIVIPDLAHHDQELKGIQQCATYNPPGPMDPGTSNFVRNTFVLESKV